MGMHVNVYLSPSLGGEVLEGTNKTDNTVWEGL